MPVSFLKNIIAQKYNIDKSIIILSIKVYNSYFIIMADNFPLYFYKVKDCSIIYIQIMGKPELKEEMINKIKRRENKSKYLKRLNIFQKKRNMEAIREQNLKEKNNIDDLPKIIEKRYNNTIINNKLNEFKYIMNKYKNNIDINNKI